MVLIFLLCCRGGGSGRGQEKSKGSRNFPAEERGSKLYIAGNLYQQLGAFKKAKLSKNPLHLPALIFAEGNKIRFAKKTGCEEIEITCVLLRIHCGEMGATGGGGRGTGEKPSAKESRPRKHSIPRLLKILGGLRGPEQ